MRIHILGATGINQPVNVAEPDVFALHTKLQKHVEAGNPRRPTAGRNDLDVFEFLARNVQCVGCSSANNDGGAVLIVVKNPNIHPLAANFFDDKAIRRFDVFQIDCAKSGL